jgi:hypothetical protein
MENLQAIGRFMNLESKAPRTILPHTYQCTPRTSPLPDPNNIIAMHMQSQAWEG